MRLESEDAQGADDARDAEVVVVEAFEPIAGGVGEVGTGGDEFVFGGG